MARICRKCLQVGCLIAFGAFLIASAKPLPQPEIEPQLTAGASKFPVIDWRTTEIKVTEPQPEIIKVADPIPEPPQAVSQEIVKDSQGIVKESPETPTEPQETVDDIDLLYRTVQAEGYTMGFEGMRYITDAILNLARERGCSVYEVLTSGAYTVVNNGQIWRETLYQDTIDAVNAELGGQLDYNIKYFRTNHFHTFGIPQFSYGNVYFSS